MTGPAFAALAAAIDRKIPADTAAQLLADYRAEVRQEQDAEPQYAVVFERPDTDCQYAWGPFSNPVEAQRFAEFVTAEIDPARITAWNEATAMPGVRLSDPLRELLVWRDNVALSGMAQLRQERNTAVATVAEQVRNLAYRDRVIEAQREQIAEREALRSVVARFLANALEGQDVSEYDLTAYLADAGIDLSAEIAAHRSALNANT